MRCWTVYSRLGVELFSAIVVALFEEEVAFFFEGGHGNHDGGAGVVCQCEENRSTGLVSTAPADCGVTSTNTLVTSCLEAKESESERGRVK